MKRALRGSRASTLIEVPLQAIKGEVGFTFEDLGDIGGRGADFFGEGGAERLRMLEKAIR